MNMNDSTDDFTSDGLVFAGAHGGAPGLSWRGPSYGRPSGRNGP